jgi:hypothetical protein
MRLMFIERDDHASGQKPVQLCLSMRTANLRDDGSRHIRHDAKFQADLMFRPYLPVVSIGRYEYASVIDHVRHAGRRTFRDLCS